MMKYNANVWMIWTTDLIYNLAEKKKYSLNVEHDLFSSLHIAFNKYNR